MVKRYDSDEIAAILESMGYDADTASQCANIATNVNEALKIAGVSKERLQYFEFFVSLMRKAYGRKVAELREWSVAVAALGR